MRTSRRSFGPLLLAGAVAGLVVTGPAATATTPGGAGGLVVPTQSGLVRGSATAFTRQFRGIPYAAAPVGRLRWQPPQPPRTWTGVRAALHDPNNCPQLAGIDPGLRTTAVNENCLGLDVVTPLPAGGAPRPVYVFIHGGAFIVGHAGFEDMATFVQKTGVVAVTINYRLGALGFLDLPGLDTARGAGNFALLDQQAALRWVQRNIRAFGGDPASVTVGGQSAGGGSVCAQLASPPARGLFQRAILESGWDCGGARTHAQATAEGIALARKVGCTGASLLSCLRATPVRKILRAAATFPLDVVGPAPTWAPEVGTPVLPEAPSAAFADGSSARVPVLLGSNSSDIPGLGCQTQSQARSLSKWAPTYRYDFADETAPPLPGRPPAAAGHGAQHSAELEYLYSFNGLPAHLNVRQQDLADAMIQYWSHFISAGNPNVWWLHKWPRFTPTHPRVQTLTVHGIVTTEGYAQQYGCGRQ